MKHLTTAVTLLAFALVAHAGDPILERQELMEGMKDNALKPMVGMARGELPFDAAAVAAGLAIMADVAEQAPALFPDGSDSGHDTAARPAVWTDRSGFDAKMDEFAGAVNTARASPPQDVDQLRAALTELTGTCKGCHDDYRVEKE